MNYPNTNQAMLKIELEGIRATVRQMMLVHQEDLAKPRCELCRFWNGGWETSLSVQFQGQHSEAEESKTLRACCRFPSHDIRHKGDWCGEFASADGAQVTSTDFGAYSRFGTRCEKDAGESQGPTRKS